MSNAASKARRRLSALSKEPIGAEIPPMLKSMKNDGPRGAGILAACLVEDTLQALLARNMPNYSKSLHDDLFDGLKPLASFSAKIDVGYALGLYGAITRADMHTMRVIRNALAHAKQIITFKTQEVSDVCSTFNSIEYIGAKDARKRYMQTAKMLALFLNQRFDQNALMRAAYPDYLSADQPVAP